ncbi:hypothetical protein FSST1_006311 [Fusarium sambucinum]
MTQEATNRIPALEFEGSLLQVSVPKAALDPATTTHNTTEEPVTSAPEPTDSTSGKHVASAPIDLPRSVDDYKCDPVRMNEFLKRLEYPPEYTYSKTWNKAKRKISLIHDVQKTDNPVEDTLWLFPNEICISEKCDDVIWNRNKLLYPGGVKAVVPTSDVFIGPLEEGSHATTTSQGHHVKHPRPAGVGPGWGDYDHYQGWQLRGRKVMSHMVPDKRWPTSIPANVEFEITTDGEPKPGDIINTANELFDELHYETFTTKPIGLRERLEKVERAKADRDKKAFRGKKQRSLKAYNGV